jgi:hypothetical protein
VHKPPEIDWPPIPIFHRTPRNSEASPDRGNYL